MKYSICPKCSKKGFHDKSGDTIDLILTYGTSELMECKYCEYIKKENKGAL